MSSGSNILLKIVSENRFSGKTDFYTIGPCDVGELELEPAGRVERHGEGEHEEGLDRRQQRRQHSQFERNKEFVQSWVRSLFNDLDQR